MIPSLMRLERVPFALGQIALWFLLDHVHYHLVYIGLGLTVFGPLLDLDYSEPCLREVSIGPLQINS